MVVSEFFRLFVFNSGLITAVVWACGKKPKRREVLTIYKRSDEKDCGENINVAGGDLSCCSFSSMVSYFIGSNQNCIFLIQLVLS